MNKTVILAVPYLYGLDQCIEKNLRHHGFDVINLCYDERDSYYPNLASRVVNAWHKHVSKSHDYKKRLKFLRYQQDIEQKLAALGGRKADYALCIRANIYPKYIIETIRAHSKVCVNYQWDGIDRFPDILEYLPYFDRFFVFDHSDRQKYPQYGFQTASNFYFDFPLANVSQPSDGLYFLGGHEAGRVPQVQAFLAEASRLALPLDFYLYCKDDRARQLFGDRIHYIDRSGILSFEQNLGKVAGCRAVVDFLNDVHQSLSFRTFYALRFDKKLITTNASVKHYDFYHPDNILVWDGSDLSGLADFMARPYQPLPPEIKEKYSFGNWLHYVFDIEPYAPIELPTPATVVSDGHL